MLTFIQYYIPFSPEALRSLLIRAWRYPIHQDQWLNVLPGQKINHYMHVGSE